MKKLLLFVCLLPGAVHAQTLTIDGLKSQLQSMGKLRDGSVKDSVMCSALKALVRAYVNVNIDSSFHYNNLLIRFAEKPVLKKELIYAYQYAGYLFQVSGDYHQSIRYHYKALSLAEKTKQYNRMAASYGWLAHAYTSLKEFPKAAKFCQQGLEILKTYPDSYVEASILNVEGAIFRQEGKLDLALNVNQRLLDLARRKHHIWYEAQGMHAIGWVYKEMNNMPMALRYFGNALELARKTGSVDLQGSILLNISNLYFRQKNWAKALAYCNVARETARGVKNSSIVAEAYENLYKIYKQTDRPAKALSAYENFVLLKDSLSKEKTEHRIETLQAQYDNVQKTSDLQKKEAELLVNRRTRNELSIGIISIVIIAGILLWNNGRLQKKNWQINKQRKLLEVAREELSNINRTLEVRVEERTQELVDANQELIKKNEDIKAALFKGQTIERKRVAIELHDNLSSLLSAVNMSMQHINTENLSLSEQSVYRNVRHLVQNAYAEVRNISHNILPTELEKEGLISTLTSLIDKLNQNSPLQFSLMVAGMERRLPLEIEFNVYSMVFELINNAIKHSKATLVVISLRRTHSEVELTVTDDGIGLIESSAKRGVGLQNIQTRLESLGGTFSSILPRSKGTQVIIKIPIEIWVFDGN
jgi:signal transduction histidine kinase